MRFFFALWLLYERRPAVSDDLGEIFDKTIASKKLEKLTREETPPHISELAGDDLTPLVPAGLRLFDPLIHFQSRPVRGTCSYSRKPCFPVGVAQRHVTKAGPYFLIGRSSSPKICRISIRSPSSAGQFCMSWTSSSFDVASTIQ